MVDYPESLTIPPFKNPCSERVRVPGSKSLSNRALILAALSEQKVTLKGLLFSRDTRLMLEALQKLGFEVEIDESKAQVVVQGLNGGIPVKKANLFVGNAGTAARFLTAFLCLCQGGVYELDGDPEMHERPMKELLDALSHQGAKFTYHGEEGHFPFRLESNGLSGGELPIDTTASSQFLSALLMVAPLAEGDLQISAKGIRPAFVEMTCELMGQFGVEVNREGAFYSVGAGQQYQLEREAFGIEPDVTAASYFIALPRVAGGSLLIEGLKESMLQGDLQFIDVMRELGLQPNFGEEGLLVKYDDFDRSREYGFDFNTFSDTFLTLAAIVPVLGVRVTIKGIAHTRHQETDRVAGMATELRRLGVEVEEGEGYLTINGRSWAPKSVTIQTYKDHRFAMSFGILGSARGFGEEAWLTIEDPSCCSKTFPQFFEILNSIRN